MTRWVAIAAGLVFLVSLPAVAQTITTPAPPVVPTVLPPEVEGKPVPVPDNSNSGKDEQEADIPTDSPDSADPASADPQAPSISHDLPAHFATYLGGPGIDDVVAVAITPAANVVVAGRLQGIAFGGQRVDLLEGAASLFILPPDGKPLISHTRVGSHLTDMAVSASSGRIAIAGGLGVAVLSPDATAFIWRDSLPVKASRVAIGSDDSVALLDGKRVSLYDPAGRRLGRVDLDHAVVTDIEVDSENKLIFVTGFNNVRDVNSLAVQSAFVEAWDFDMNRVWKNWGYAGAQLGNRTADTHGLRLTIGLDGELYFLGEAAGGDSLFLKHPTIPAREGMLIFSDRYNTPVGPGRAVLAFFARLDPLTGRLKKAQYAFPRLGPDKLNRTNTFLPRAIAADELGNVFIGGVSGLGIPDRDKQTISGTPVGTYGGDPTLLVVSADFQRRIRWTTLTAGGIGSHTRIDSIGVAHGLAVAGVTVRGGRLITVDPIVDKPDGGLSPKQTDGYVILWRAP